MVMFGPVDVPIALAAGAVAPRYATDGSAGADLCACLSDSVTLYPGERRLIPTGLRLELPAGYEAQIRPRSGLALKYGVTLLNSPGTIDSDYRGELKVLLVNLGDAEFVVSTGARVAQLVIAEISKARFVTASLRESARGEGGFGSTGT